MSSLVYDANQSKYNRAGLWIPAIELAGVPQPKTIIFPKVCQDISPSFEELIEAIKMGERIKVPWLAKLASDIENEFGDDPVFLRTDQKAGSVAEFEQASVVKNVRQLPACLRSLLFVHAGLIQIPIPQLLVIREYLHLASVFVNGQSYQPFKAFGSQPSFPIGAERRTTIRIREDEDPAVTFVCIHPRWPKESIINPSVDDWQARLEVFNTISEDEARLLRDYALSIGKAIIRLDSGKTIVDLGIDFFLSQEKGWLAIDIQHAHCAQHIERCPEYMQLRSDWEQLHYN